MTGLLRTLALAVVCSMLVAGVAQSAPSRVEVKTRGPNAQQPDPTAGDEDPGKSGTQVRPRAGGSHGFPADVVVYDENGHNDIVKVNVTVLRADNVTVHDAAVAASKLNANGTRATWRATVTMTSDAGPGTYILRAAVLDRDAAVAYAWTNFTYEPLAALTLAQDRINMAPSSLAGFQPGANSSATPIQVNITNAGNVAVDLTINATALSNATLGASVPASSLRASRSSDTTSGVALSGSTQTVPGAAIAPSSGGSVYLSVVLPSGLRPGDYTGELTVGAVAAS